MAGLHAAGYDPVRTKVRLVLAWKGKKEKQDKPESVILLPDIYLQKTDNTAGDYDIIKSC